MAGQRARMRRTSRRRWPRISLPGGVLPGRRITAVAASQMWVGRKAALVVMRVEEGELLMAVNDIKRVGDVERHAFGRRGIARQPQIDQHPAEPDDGAQVWQVL